MRRRDKCSCGRFVAKGTSSRNGHQGAKSRWSFEGRRKAEAGELRGAVEDAKSQAKSWQAEGEAYVRDNPTKAVLVALGVGLLLGFLLRK